MEPKKRVLGEEHANTLTGMHNLAIAWKRRGNFEDALALMQACYRLRQKYLAQSIVTLYMMV